MSSPRPPGQHQASPPAPGRAQGALVDDPPQAWREWWASLSQTERAQVRRGRSNGAQLPARLALDARTSGLRVPGVLWHGQDDLTVDMPPALIGVIDLISDETRWRHRAAGGTGG